MLQLWTTICLIFCPSILCYSIGRYTCQEIESLNKVDYTDVELLDANGYKEYYNGNKTKEYMINIIEEKAWLYLNE